MLNEREATQDKMAGDRLGAKQGAGMAESSQAKEVDALIQSGYKSIVQCTKKAQSFPSAHENSLLVAFPQYIESVARTSDKVMGLVDALLQGQHIAKSMAKLYLEGQKDILVEANDKLLESINGRIDVMAGIKAPTCLVTQSKVVKESWNQNARASNVWQEVHEARKKKRPSWFLMSKAEVTTRPQLSFPDKVDNSYETLFEPRLKEKPNALRPLAILLEKYDAVECYCHPYEYELDVYVPAERLVAVHEPQAPPPLETTPLVMVTEPGHVTQLLADLKEVDEVAVDLEYHSYRSYQGFTCLMQLSTRRQDYIVDTLALRDHLHVLNEVFTDPRVLKVFHGAESDIRWLQKDLGLYVVGMFDTHQACKFLPMPRQSLAYLLKHYCGVDSDKTFQLLDWRVRPLPSPAVEYARADTHYLLYVYDCMKQDLAAAAHGKGNLIHSVFSNSRHVCKLKYNKPVFDADGYRSVFRSHALLNNQQSHALAQLWRWRDQAARLQDESPAYLLPNHMLLQMAQSLPRDVQGIFACCNPVPQGVREHALALHAILLKSRLQPLIKTIEKPRESLAEKKKPAVTPPHDSMDSLNYRGLPPVFPDKLPTAREKQPVHTPPPSSRDTSETTHATIGLFFEDKTRVSSSKLQKIKLKTARFETPYQRFLKSKEYARAVQEKLDKEQAAGGQKTPPVAPAPAPPPIAVKVEPVVLKEIKTEEKVEMEKAKRKKALQEKEEAEVPSSKKIKVEKPEVNVEPNVKANPAGPKENVKANPAGPKENVKANPAGPKENLKANSTGPKENVANPAEPKQSAGKKTHAVDYSKVNYNKKFMAKTPGGNTDNQKGRKSQGKGGRGKRKKQR